MDNNKMVPTVRLNGFTGDWKNTLFNEIVSFFSGLTYSPKDITDGKGTLVLRSSNVQNGEIDLKDSVYVRNEVVNCKNVEIGDIIVVVRNGSRSLIGKHTVIKNKMENTVIGAFMTGIKANNSNFINALLDSQKFSLEVEKNLGATINQITIGSLRKMEFIIPSSSEQIQIGNFFKTLDGQINAQEQKHQKLVNLKKAMLEKMFPKEGTDVPEIRFNGFTDKWEEKKLGDIASFKKGQGFSKKDLKNNGTPIILYGRLYTKYQTEIYDVDTYADSNTKSVFSNGNEVIVPASGESAEDISRASAVLVKNIILGGDLYLKN